MYTCKFVTIIIILISKFVWLQNFDELRASVTNVEQRAYIKVNVLLETSPAVVYKQLQLALPDTSMARTSVYDWYNDFKHGRRTDIEDITRPGRTRTMMDEDHKNN